MKRSSGVGASDGRRLKLLFVTDYYPPLRGGATRAFEQLASRMSERGHEVTVATATQPGAERYEVRDGIVVHRLPDFVSRIPGTSADPHRHTPPPFPDPELAWRLRRLVRQTAPDVIYAFGWIVYSLCAGLPRDHPRLLFSVRDYGNICPKRSLVRRGQGCSGPGWGKCATCAPELYGPVKGIVTTAGVLGGRHLLTRRMSAIQSCSRYAQDLVLENLPRPRPDEDSLYVIPDFRDEAEPPGPIPPGVPEVPFILFVGALRQIKGINILLSAYARMAEPKPPLVLVGAAAPDTPAEFPADVVVLDAVTNPTVMAMWDRALFGVAPSLLPEPLGNVVHEAMSRGKVVIGTTPGGHADMIDDGVNGLLVPAGDEVALAAAMALLAADGDLRERLGTAARVKAEDFSAERVFPRFVDMFAREARQRS
jgi:glycosyltransferase involved in cell wall biosynthesis